MNQLSNEKEALSHFGTINNQRLMLQTKFPTFWWRWWKDHGNWNLTIENFLKKNIFLSSCFSNIQLIAWSLRNLNHIFVPERPITPRVLLPEVQLRDVSIWIKDFGSNWRHFFVYVHINFRLLNANFSQQYLKNCRYTHELWTRSSKSLTLNSSESSCYPWIFLFSTHFYIPKVWIDM